MWEQIVVVSLSLLVSSSVGVLGAGLWVLRRLETQLRQVMVDEVRLQDDRIQTRLRRQSETQSDSSRQSEDNSTIPQAQNMREQYRLPEKWFPGMSLESLEQSKLT